MILLNYKLEIFPPGSAQSLFEQMQAKAVNTGNRLLTPLIPPTDATKLNVDKLKDSLVGMFYGAALGDSLGLLTDQMTGDEAEFHYSRRHMDQFHLYRDEVRSEARASASSFFLSGAVTQGILSHHTSSTLPDTISHF